MTYGLGVLGSTIWIFYLAYTRYDDPSDPRFTRNRNRAEAPALAATPRVSFLVAVKDERDVIESCVRSMVASDYPDVEVIVVDDASTDGTADILRSLQAELHFTLVALEQNVGKKHALVRGARARAGRRHRLHRLRLHPRSGRPAPLRRSAGRPPGTGCRLRPRPRAQRRRDDADQGPGHLVRGQLPRRQGRRVHLRLGHLRVRSARGLSPGRHLELPAGLGQRPLHGRRVPVRHGPPAHRVRPRAALEGQGAQGCARRLAVRRRRSTTPSAGGTSGTSARPRCGPSCRSTYVPS